MQLQTPVTQQPLPFQLTHQLQLMSTGSCFSENIGRKFAENKFRICINPFGQQYNAFSIASGIKRLMSQQPYTQKELIGYKGLFHSFDHHSFFSRSTATETLAVINQSLEQGCRALQKADVLFITLATSHVYRLRDTHRVVSNCHQFPANNFDLYPASAHEMIEVLDEALTTLGEMRPDLQLVFSISPVRYLSYGSFENSVSKAQLFTVVEDLMSKFDGTSYFPAYEIMMDELRDYRFYNEDMVHPSPQAIHYIWEKLCASYMDKGTRDLLQEVGELRKAAHHRPRNPHSAEHRKFVQMALEKIEAMQQQRGLDFGEERQLLNAAIS